MTRILECGRWIRNEYRNWSFATYWGLLSVALAAAAAAFLVSDLRNGKTGGGLFVLGLFGALPLARARHAFGCARAGLLITAEEVLIRNPWRSYDLPFASIRGFAARTQAARLGNPTPGVVLELQDGTACSVWTLAREGLVWNTPRNVRRWDEVARELNGLVQLGVQNVAARGSTGPAQRHSRWLPREAGHRGEDSGYRNSDST